ncbi:MAG: flagellar export chaperone FliS [Pseudomonadales bacterium]|jgi:flagellar protein FliS
MNSQQAIKQYQRVNTQSSIDGASPHQLISMLINGALSRLASAKGCIERRDYAEKGVQLGKSIDIIGGLQSSLDMEAGGDVSANLDALYDYMIRRLSEASRQNDMTIVDEVINLLKDIKQGWDGIPQEFHHLSSQKNQASAAG